MKCKNCNNKESIKYSKYSNGEFCSIECSRSYSTKNKRSEINIKLSKIQVSKRKNKYCISCGILINNNKVKYCNDCKNYCWYKKLYKKLNINDTNLKVSNDKSLKILKSLYFDDMLTSTDIREMYKIQTNTLFYFFNKNKISFRTLSETTTNAIINGKIGTNNSYPKILSNTKYKCGWHESWHGKKCYLRSSYEFRYADELDNLKINYSVEQLRIKYYDTQQKKERISIPDFYLIDENKIIEIKSPWTLDKINMSDKEKSYRNNGYDFELIVMKYKK